MTTKKLLLNENENDIHTTMAVQRFCMKPAATSELQNRTYIQLFINISVSSILYYIAVKITARYISFKIVK